MSKTIKVTFKKKPGAPRPFSVVSHFENGRKGFVHYKNEDEARAKFDAIAQMIADRDAKPASKADTEAANLVAQLQAGSIVNFEHDGRAIAQLRIKGSSYVMRKIGKGFGDGAGEQTSIWISATPPARLLAHWTGFCANSAAELDAKPNPRPFQDFLNSSMN